jgi:hypothetical protein
MTEDEFRQEVNDLRENLSKQKELQRRLAMLRDPERPNEGSFEEIQQYMAHTEAVKNERRRLEAEINELTEPIHMAEVRLINVLPVANTPSDLIWVRLGNLGITACRREDTPRGMRASLIVQPWEKRDTRMIHEMIVMSREMVRFE